MKYNPYLPPPISDAIIKTLAAITLKYGKNRCYCSADTLLYLLEKFHGIHICKRTLFNWESFLKKRGYILCKQYLRVNREGKTVFGANSFWLLPRALKYLRSLAGWAKKAFNIYRRQYDAYYKRPTDLNKSVVRVLGAYFKGFLEEKVVAPLLC